MATPEIEVSDDEIESLMAELEMESAKVVEAQAAAKAEAAEPVVAKPTKPTPVEVIEPVVATPVTTSVESVEDDLAAIEAEAEAEAAAAVAAKPEPVAAKPAPVAEPVAAKPKPAAKPVPVEPVAVVAVPEAKAASEDGMVVPDDSVVKGLQHYVDPGQFKIDTRVTEATLDACMIEQNGLRAYYGAQAARAEAQHDRLKARFEVVEATLYDYHRKLLAATGEKVTEKMVENAVKVDPRWFKAKNTVIEAGTIAAINKGLVESLKDRRDMIIQLGADRRDEYKGQARVLAQEQERSDFKARAEASARREAAA